jgi:catechol 2,3-dioxygenase-like lactoylglutathione lyase family enzyme
MALTGTTLDRVALVAMDAEKLAAFYGAAFGFSITHKDGGCVRLGLGRQTLDLLTLAPPGKPCPDDIPGWSPLFQHIAIVVSDMAAAVAQLSRQPGWRPISQGGPQRLPASSGGVTAFKFRDPEGHPLEFLAFPAEAMPNAWKSPDAPGPCLGFDHSAISVSDTARSIAFYEALGLSVAGKSLNTGEDQARLDGIANPQVEVTALAPTGRATPHVELLCYRGDYPRNESPVDSKDGVASRLVFSVDAALWNQLRSNQTRGLLEISDRALGLRDPDGHVLQIYSR